MDQKRDMTGNAWRISACVIMRDAAEDIGRCLGRLQNEVDEIIVVDTGSRDASKAIARRYTDRIFDYPWANDFAAARNFALDKASGDWIVFPDADESFAEKAYGSLRQVIQEGLAQAADVEAFIVTIDSIETEDGSLIEQSGGIRIFRHARALRYHDAIHEHLEWGGGRRLKTMELPHDVLSLIHTGYARERLRGKLRRNLTLLEQARDRGERKQYLYRYLSNTYLALGDYKSAIGAAKESLRRRDYPKEAPFDDWRTLYRAYETIGEKKQAQGVLERAVQEAPEFPEGHVVLARRFRREGRLREADQAYAEALALYGKYRQDQVTPQAEPLYDEAAVRAEHRALRERLAEKENQVMEKKKALGPQPDGTMHMRVGPVSGRTKIKGLAIDFNHGARVRVPQEGKWRVRIIDLAARQIVRSEECTGVTVESGKCYYVPWRIEVYQGERCVLQHTMNLRGQEVLMRFCSVALGDTLAWIPYVQAFAEAHACHVTCAAQPALHDILRATYPALRFVDFDAARTEDFYATYYLGCFQPADDRVMQPADWRILGVQRPIAGILGLPPEERRPPLAVLDQERPIKERYVCIAAQASSQSKYWNNPAGWMETIAYLKAMGYRVLCIDKERNYGLGWHQNTIPYGAEDFTGNRPLRERLQYLQHADFFIGLASGLSWLAWGAGIPVVLISGMSSPQTEFFTPYRVINYNAPCTGCWEDVRHVFDGHDFYWCPRHQGDWTRQFECTRLINSQQVIATIDRLMKDHALTAPRPGHHGK